MEVHIFGVEGKDFPFIKEDKKGQFEENITNTIKERLQLRQFDKVILSLKYCERNDGIIMQL